MRRDNGLKSGREIEGIFIVTEDDGSRYAYTMGWSYWYEDFPNLDLDIMTEGVP